MGEECNAPPAIAFLSLNTFHIIFDPRFIEKEKFNLTPIVHFIHFIQ